MRPITPRLTFGLVVAVIVLLIDVSFIVLHLMRVEGFNLDYEGNIPTFYQALKLLVICALCLNISGTTARKTLIFLGLMFGYIGLDEWLQIHEFVSNSIHNYLLSIGRQVGFSAWLISYAPLFVFGLGSLYFACRLIFEKGLLKLTSAKLWFVLGIICFGLVPLVELLGTEGWKLEGDAYTQTVAVEEGLELLGATGFLISFLFIRAAVSTKPLLQLKSDTIVNESRSNQLPV